MSFAKSVQNPGAKDAVSRAYAQYITDDRLDTDEDEEAFGDAMYFHIIDAVEDFFATVIGNNNIDPEYMNDFRNLLGL